MHVLLKNSTGTVSCITLQVRDGSVLSHHAVNLLPACKYPIKKLYVQTQMEEKL